MKLRRIIKMIFLRFITDRWDAQRRAKIEQEARERAEDIVMSVIDATETNEQDAERLKMKVARILLREEMSDSWKSPMDDSWKSPYKGDKNDDYTASRDPLSER
jgi:hypothetical protein